MGNWQSDKRRVVDNPPRIITITVNPDEIHCTGRTMCRAYYSYFPIECLSRWAKFNPSTQEIQLSSYSRDKTVLLKRSSFGSVLSGQSKMCSWSES